MILWVVNVSLTFPFTVSRKGRQANYGCGINTPYGCVLKLGFTKVFIITRVQYPFIFETKRAKNIVNI